MQPAQQLKASVRIEPFKKGPVHGGKIDRRLARHPAKESDSRLRRQPSLAKQAKLSRYAASQRTGGRERFQREQLEGKIQERYGHTKDVVKKDVDDWHQSLK
jgi:hypothetical protein